MTGKIIMNKAGIFDGLSAAVTWHPFDRNRVSYDIWQAQDIKNYKFFGTAAHASKHPEMGRSALDAAELMNVGVNYLREHVEGDVRMHYTYTNTDSSQYRACLCVYQLLHPFCQMGTHAGCFRAGGRLRQGSGSDDRNPCGD